MRQLRVAAEGWQRQRSKEDLKELSSFNRRHGRPLKDAMRLPSALHRNASGVRVRAYWAVDVGRIGPRRTILALLRVAISTVETHEPALCTMHRTQTERIRFQGDINESYTYARHVLLACLCSSL